MNNPHGELMSASRYAMNQGNKSTTGVSYPYAPSVRLQQQNMSAMRGVHPQNAIYPNIGANADSAMNGLPYSGDYYQRNLATSNTAGNPFLQQQQMNTQFQAKRQASTQQYTSVSSPNVMLPGMKPSVSQLNPYMQRPTPQKPIYDLYRTTPTTVHYSPQLRQVLSPVIPKEQKFVPLPDSICPLESKRHHSEKEFGKLYTTPDILVKEVLSFNEKPKVGNVTVSNSKEHEILVASLRSLCEIAVN